MSRLRPTLHDDPCAALPDYVRARCTPGVVGPPRPGSLRARAALARAAELLREEASAPKYGRGAKGFARNATGAAVGGQ